MEIPPVHQRLALLGVSTVETGSFQHLTHLLPQGPLPGGFLELLLHVRGRPDTDLK